MKTMKLGDSIRRVTDTESYKLINQGWSYCPKKEWKDNVRVVKESVKEEKKDKKK